MTGRPTYPPGALGRIESLGEKAIKAFFNEVPPEPLNVLIGWLPSLPGFRPGSSVAVERQLQSLAKKLAAHKTPKVFPRSSEEIVLYGLWRAWSESQLAETTTVRDLFDSLEQGSDDESGADTSGRMDTALKALVASGSCSRETLERFITFSPFEDVDGLRMLVKGARTSAEIKRESTLLELPDKLHKVEAGLQALERKFDASERGTLLSKGELDEIRRAVSDLRSKAAEDRAAAIEFKQTASVVAGSQKELEQAVTRLTHASDRLTGRAAVGERETAAIAERHRPLEGKVDQIEESLIRISEQALEHERRLGQIAADVRAKEGDRESQNERLSRFDEMAARIDQLESTLLKLAEAKAGAIATENNGVESAASRPVEFALVVERLRLESGLSVKPLRSVAEILSSLDAALGEAGLKKSMATVFAEEILAALVSEQIVFFRGGYAVDVARKCAVSVSATSVFRVALPLGMTDPSLFRQRLGGQPNDISSALSSIVIEGVNNSPLDLLRDVLLDQVTYRLGGPARQAPTVIFASLADGPGAFPVDPSYLELGPVFDLEQMDWHRLRREKLPKLGSVENDDWRSIATAWDGKTIDYEEALQGAKRLAHRRNTRIEANVVRAFSVLKSIRRERGLTALQSTTFGWLMPYWQALAAKADDIDAQIDSGKCDGTVVDERLKSLLAEYRYQATGERP